MLPYIAPEGDDNSDGFDNAPNNCDASGDAVVARGGAGKSFVCAFGGIVDRVDGFVGSISSGAFGGGGTAWGEDGDTGRHGRPLIFHPWFILL